MIEQIMACPHKLGEWEEALNVAKKVSEIITAVNNIEAKLQCASPNNTGRQCALQMPPTCPECLVYSGCNGIKGNDYCCARLWRHFCRA